MKNINSLLKIVLYYLINPLIIAIEVVGVLTLHPYCEGSFWKLLLLYIGVFVTYDLYSWIKNYCDTITFYKF